MTAPVRYFDDRYLERVVLRDGREAVLRCIRASDRQLFINGFARLSDQSRYTRFFTPKPRLTNSELAYLTELDNENHLAIGIALANPQGEPLHDDAGLGVARFIRLKADLDTAEAAIVVVDDAQGLGLGRLLFSRLVQAATERSVVRFRTEVLSGNGAMRALLEGLVDSLEDTHIQEHREGPVMITDFELPKMQSGPPAQTDTEVLRGPLYELLKAAAHGRGVATRAVASLLGWRQQGYEPDDGPREEPTERHDEG